MKRIIYLASLLCVIFLSSCNKEPYNHAVAVLYPSIGFVYHYADQTSDSILFQTFDSYEVKSQSDWMHVNETYDSPKKTIQNGYYFYYIGKVGLDMEPNTTGKCRYGYVTVRSYGDDGWDQTAVGSYYQYAWHNITKPTPKYWFTNNMPDSARFELKVAAECEADSLIFTSYLDWQLEVPSNSFVHPVKTNGGSGIQIIKLDFDENKTNQLDSVELKLITTPQGIETPIWVYRKEKKEEKE